MRAHQHGFQEGDDDDVRIDFLTTCTFGDKRPIEEVADQYDNLGKLDPDEALARLNLWAALGGNETGPPEDWREAVKLIDAAYHRLAATRTPRETLVALSDAYSTVIERYLNEA